MKPKQAAILSGLLKEVIRDGTDFYPDEIWLDIHQLFALPYVELVIPRSICGQSEIFLVRRPATDPYWPSMWHLPGGLWRTHQSEIQACSSVARRELGVRIIRVEEVMTYKWTTHPYGNPISHVCICQPKGKLTKAQDRGYFRQLPQPFIPEQIAFVETSLRYLDQQGQKNKEESSIKVYRKNHSKAYRF